MNSEDYGAIVRLFDYGASHSVEVYIKRFEPAVADKHFDGAMFACGIGEGAAYYIGKTVKQAVDRALAPVDKVARDAAVRTLQRMGYSYINGAECWKPPIGKSLFPPGTIVRMDDE